MLSNSRIKYLRSLHQKKFRSQENKTILEGSRLIQQALIGKAGIEEVWLTEDYAVSPKSQTLVKSLVELGKSFEKVKAKFLHQICDSQNEQGVAALVSIPKYKKTGGIPALYFDGISDPGNMGTLLRTAVWFGIKTIYFSADSVDPFNSKVLRSGMGAHFHLDTLNQIDHSGFIAVQKQKGCRIIGTNMSGKSIHKFQLSDKKNWLLILGNEARGISEKLDGRVDNWVSIAGTGKMESLNVAVAGGIILNCLTQ